MAICQCLHRLDSEVSPVAGAGEASPKQQGGVRSAWVELRTV